ncbi:B-box domain protein 30 [Senna tora]|uniref:B-box domain protein 30 n=1 Tax=Senna tora TaxID=362788 RepID=A0A834WH22_9FABA|nr:B-box domain protein 30 [Senna tora]
MSKGGEDKEKHTVFHRGLPFEEVASRGGTRDSINCELCGSQASLYCQADDAYLCRKCDKWVHKANFLAFRHVRCFLCKTCQNLTQRYLIGASVEVVLPPMVSWAELCLPNSITHRKYSRMQ